MRLEKISADGDTVFVRHIPYTPIPVPATLADSARDLTVERFVSGHHYQSRREALQIFDRHLALPAFFPPADMILAASSGDIWIQRRRMRMPG